MKRAGAVVLMVIAVGGAGRAEAKRSAVGGAGRAEAKRSAVVIAAQPCVGRLVDLERLLAALRIELPSSLGKPVSVARREGPADLVVRIECDGAVLRLDVARRDPSGTWHGDVALGDVVPRLRPRTLALAIAEELIALDSPARPPRPPVAVADPPPAPTAASTPVAAAEPALPVMSRPVETIPPLPSPSPGTHANRLRLTRNLAIGLAVASLAPIIIGGPLLALGEHDPTQPIQGLVIPGAILVGLGGAMLAGAGVSLGMWLYERDQVAARLSLAPTTQGASLVVAGRF